jgi:hypothetical protein
MRLFHFSDRDDISVFVPRAPLRHPDGEPLVYAIDEPHSPLYHFPRNCPRIAAWALDRGVSAARILIDSRFEAAWRTESLVRYEFDSAPFIDCHDHGVWICRETVAPIRHETFRDLPALSSGVEVVPSLAEASKEFYDPMARQFKEGWHVSMIRMSLLPDWDDETGLPVMPR